MYADTYTDVCTRTCIWTTIEFCIILSKDKINTGICIVSSQISIDLKLRADSFMSHFWGKIYSTWNHAKLHEEWNSPTSDWFCLFVCFSEYYKFQCKLSTCNWSAPSVLPLFTVLLNAESILNNGQTYWIKIYFIWENHKMYGCLLIRPEGSKCITNHLSKARWLPFSHFLHDYGDKWTFRNLFTGRKNNRETSEHWLQYR